MKTLDRENLGAELRLCLIERYGSLSKAADALGVEARDLYRAYSKHGRKNFTVPLRYLKRIGYTVHFVVRPAEGGQ